MPGLIDLSLRLPVASGARLGRTLLAYGVTTAQASGLADPDLREVVERWQTYRAGPRLLNARDWCEAAGAVGTVPAGAAFGTVRLCPTMIERVAPLILAAHRDGAAAWSTVWRAATAGALDAVGPLGETDMSPADEAITGQGLFYQDAIETLVGTGVVVIPALAPRALPLLVNDQPDLTDSRQYRALVGPDERASQTRAWQEALKDGGGSWRRGWLRERQRLVARIVAGGGHVAAASGSPLTPYGLGLHAELRLLAGAGLKPGQVLRTATAEAARALGLQADLGTLAPGLRADLIVLNGDPLRELGDLLSVDAVMTDGYLRPAAELLSPTPGAAEKFTPANPALRATRKPRRP